jgi:hypothetical protein
MTGRDPVVARALAQLPVPDHVPDFWDRLDAELAAARPELRLPRGTMPGGDGSPGASPVDGVAAVGGSVVADVVALHGPRRSRPDRRGPLRALAVAAVFAVLVGGVVRAAQDGDGGTTTDLVPATEAFEPGPSTTAATVPTDGTTTIPATGSTPPTTIPAAVQGAVDEALAFVGSMAAEDVEAAALRVGIGTETYTATMDGLDAYLASTTGQWGSYVDAAVSTVVIDPGSVVVVFDTGTGLLGVLPVVRSESLGTWFVEPLAFDPATGGRWDGPLSPLGDEDGVRHVSADDNLVISTPFPLQLALVGGIPDRFEAVDVGEQGIAITWSPPPDAPVGPAILVAALRSGDGPVFIAEAYRLDLS